MNYNPTALTIHWVRHAESCANFDQGTVNDNIPKKYNKSCGYQQIRKVIQQNKQSKKYIGTSTYKGSFKYEPNLSFIGMQHAIMLGTNFVVPEMNNLPYDCVFVSPMTRTIMTALLAFRRYPNIKIFVVPFISEHLNKMSTVKMDYQNSPVNSYELKKKIKFIKDWLEESWLEYFDDIEVIQILNHLKNKIKDDKQKILIYNEIMEALQCRTRHYTEGNNCSNKIFNSKINNKQIICNMKKVIHLLEQNINVFDNDDQPLIKNLMDLTDPSIIRGPEVDFSILVSFENANISLKSNFDNFYDKIIPLFINSFKNNKILCVTHGSVLKEYFNNKYGIQIKDVANTQVMEEIINIIKIQNKYTSYPLELDPNKYLPISIRNSFQNFEYLNFDICRTESLKGILNYYMTSEYEKRKQNKNKNINDTVPNRDTLLVPNKSNFTTGLFKNMHSKDFVNPDLQFYYNKKWKDYMADNISSIKGGYYDKYIKYKQKYLYLKWANSLEPLKDYSYQNRNVEPNIY